MNVAVKKPVTPTPSADQQKRSGILVLNPGQTLFHENDEAESLFIIQKGRLRLYRPKGKGFIELAVLCAGEVIGEMAFFAESDTEKKRSCSAQALARTEIIEISFAALGKAMTNLNPWFKTIVNTLATRLRKTNAKVKELETNSVAGGYGADASHYKFFRNVDIIRMLSTLYFIFRTFGVAKEKMVEIHKRTIQYYFFEVYNLQESKMEELFLILIESSLLSVTNDKDNLPNLYSTSSVDQFNSLSLFFYNQRVAADEKRINISSKCEELLGDILMQIESQNKGKESTLQTVDANISAIFEQKKAQNIPCEIDDLAQAREQKFLGPIVVGDENKLFCSVNYPMLKKNYFPIKIMNRINRVNEIKSNG